MATTISTQDLLNARRDIDDIGKAVNESVIVDPRYGADFKSLPMIAAEAQSTIAEWQDAINTIVVDDGVPALAVSDASGKTQQEINDSIGSEWYSRDLGYSENDRASVDGDVYQSLENGNTYDPSADISKWALASNLSFSSIEQLRKYNPNVPNSRVHLRGLEEGSTIGAGDWYYDATDTTSADNGWFIVVTNNGKRLKRVGWQSEINLDWAGIPDGGDLAVRWQEAINYADSIRLGVTHVFDCPKIVIRGQRYTMSTGVVHPTYISTEFTKSALITVSYPRSSCAYVVAMRNASGTQTIYRNEKEGVRWNHTLTATVGKVKFYFDNTDPALANGSTRPSCIVTGNLTGTTYAYQCNMRVSNIEAYEFRAAHEVLGTNSWGYRFENCGFGGTPRDGKYSVWTSSSTNVDSGERNSYVNCFMSGIRLSTPSMYIYFDNCSIDFSYDTILTVDSTARYNDIRFVNCHLENFNAYVVDSALNTTDATNTIITFSGGRILPTSNVRPSSHDIVFFNGNCRILMTGGLIIESSTYPSTNTLGAILGQNGAIVRTRNVYTKDARPRINGSFSKLSIANYFLSDGVDAIVNLTNPSVNFEVTSMGNGATGSVKISPETATKTMAVAVSSSNGYCVIRSNKFTSVQALRDYTCRPVVEIVDEASTATPRPCIWWYDADKNLIGSVAKPPYDISLTAYIANAEVPFLSRETKRIPIVHTNLTAPAGAVYAKHGFEIANMVAGKTYYIHGVELHDAIAN